MSEMVQVIGIFAIVAGVLVELLILLPNIVVKFYILVKGMFSKKSKVRSKGTKKSLVVYDWIIERPQSKI